MPFSDAQAKQLDAELSESLVHTRRKQGIELRYIEGHSAIDRANAIFGYHAWSYQVTKLELAAGVWVATILLTVTTPTGESVGREDVGVGIPAVARDSEAASPDAQETAIKGAVTDALKRALRTFGNAFGNSLYSKEGPESGTTASAGTAARTADAEGRDCPTCGGPLVFREGKTRDGRDYRAWFCQNKCGAKPIWEK